MWIWPILSGFLLGLSFENPYLRLLSLVGLIPLFFFIYTLSVDRKNRLKIFFGSWLTGFIFMALVWRWILASYPLTWMGIDNNTLSFIFVAFVWLTTVIVTSFPIALFGLGTVVLSKHNKWDLFFIPSLWIILEYLRAWIFSFLSWGSGGVIGPFWTYGNLGYDFIDTPFIIFSRFIGLYGLSFLAVFVNVWFFKGYQNIKKILIFLLVVFTIIFLPYNLIFTEKQGTVLNVVAVQTNTNDGVVYQRNLGELIIEAKSNGKLVEQPDIVIFPEGFQLFSYIGKEEQKLLNEIFPDKEKPGILITSFYQGDVKNNITKKEYTLFLDQNGKVIGTNEKYFLMPAGEVMPQVLKWVIILTGNQPILKKFAQLRAVRAGDSFESPVKFHSTNVGVLLCSGIIAPFLYSSLVNQGANILVNSASQSIFKGSWLFVDQMKNMAKFQAVANNRPLVQAANSGYSFFINADGKIIKQTSTLDTQIISAEVLPVKTKTPITVMGDWPLAAGVFILLFSLLKWL